MKITRFLVFFCMTAALPMVAQNFNEILGRPGNDRITISIVSDQAAYFYCEYGTSPGQYSQSTTPQLARPDTAIEFDLTGLVKDNKYFYRTRYRSVISSGVYLEGPERSFHTARPAGNSFTFAVEADPHLDTNTLPAAYNLTLQNILARYPDFMIDLGDNFRSEKQPKPVTQQVITQRHLLYRPYFGSVCHSVPLYLVIGNHEGENGWALTGSENSIPVMASNTRKLYYPNPLPNDFYSGDTKSEPFVGLRGNYYAWEWGNALFIVLDPYWYTTVKPDWGWTLGPEQYNWFKNVISASQAKFKFVFCHQLVGGYGNDGRGGSEFAGFYEHGGANTDSTPGFPANRPGWEKPVHALMVENHAAIYFHGHDHCFAKQDKDGVVYQEVPQPSSKNIVNFTGSQYGYVEGTLLPSRGYLLVTVTDTTAKVDYIRSYLPNEETASHKNGEVAYSYTLRAAAAGIDDKAEAGPGFELFQNAPNPFSGETTIRYKLTAPGHVRLKVFDLTGREIRTLADENQQPGSYTVSMGTGSAALAGGIYYYRLTVGENSKSMMMISR